MDSLVDIAWLIPVLPLSGSILVGLLLISFSRTMNRLSKPVSFLIISSIAISTALSIILYVNHLSGELFDWHINLGSLEFFATFYLNSNSALLLSITGLIFFAISLFSFYKLPRAIGYVRYITLLALTCGLIYLFVLDDNLLSLVLN